MKDAAQKILVGLVAYVINVFVLVGNFSDFFGAFNLSIKENPLLLIFSLVFTIAPAIISYKSFVDFLQKNQQQINNKWQSIVTFYTTYKQWILFVVSLAIYIIPLSFLIPLYSNIPDDGIPPKPCNTVIITNTVTITNTVIVTEIVQITPTPFHDPCDAYGITGVTIDSIYDFNHELIRGKTASNPIEGKYTEKSEGMEGKLYLITKHFTPPQTYKLLV